MTTTIRKSLVLAGALAPVGLDAQLSPRHHQGAKTRRLGTSVLALIIASAVAACTGGAGLDMPIQSVDHGCHTGNGVVTGAEGSGCS
jgi:hypothetical protein